MDKQFIIAGLGEILWDLLPQGKLLGGAPANFAYQVQSLGAKGHIISSVGNDSEGEEILNRLVKKKISTSHISIDPTHPTGSVEVRLDREGVPKYVIHRGVAWDFIPDSEQNLSLAEELDAICFGSLAQRSEISKKSIHRILQATRKDCLKIFDINIRQLFYTKETIEISLNLANCLKLNDEEFALLGKLFKIDGRENEVIDALMKNYNLDLIALTKGKNGSVLYSQHDFSNMRTPEVAVEDTVGAGDAFTAALCLGFLNNSPLAEIHQIATDLAAFVCTKKGAMPEVPDAFKYKQENK
jgi:fructokinase